MVYYYWDDESIPYFSLNSTKQLGDPWTFFDLEYSKRQFMQFQTDQSLLTCIRTSIGKKNGRLKTEI